MEPTIGRIVHFTRQSPKGLKIYAAIITEVLKDGLVYLTYFDPKGGPVREMGDQRLGVPFTEAPAGTREAENRWAWPARS